MTLFTPRRGSLVFNSSRKKDEKNKAIKSKIKRNMMRTETKLFQRYSDTIDTESGFSMEQLASSQSHSLTQKKRREKSGTLLELLGHH